MQTRWRLNSRLIAVTCIHWFVDNQWVRSESSAWCLYCSDVARFILSKAYKEKKVRPLIRIQWGVEAVLLTGRSTGWQIVKNVKWIWRNIALRRNQKTSLVSVILPCCEKFILLFPFSQLIVIRVIVVQFSFNCKRQNSKWRYTGGCKHTRIHAYAC